ncbi:Methyl-accepting chemotaxis protein [Onishia taeanensis]|uniref:Methyl-accepting chemotaxis protein n=1 Tax=Onishia taeanensis TaxID=284577 RepID=A0A1G7U7G6_9GAMM|nr:methyl-accepting chemotaxis protein [Halomonas taeanensis]SDG43526.1 Methyl-accepting chemotaxis protein [Halomonas taeanensis]
MKNLLNRITMGRKFVLTLALPLLAMAYFAISGIVERQQMATSMKHLQSLTAMAQQAGDLVHQLQRERGMTAGFLGSEGKIFGGKLREQRQSTDFQAKAFERHVEGLSDDNLGTEMLDHIGAIRQQLTSIDGLRQSVDGFTVPTGEVIANYTNLNADLMEVVAMMSHATQQASVSRRLGAYYNLLKAKDLAGIERAVLSSAFGADQISPATFQRFLSLIGKEQAFLASFRAMAEDAMSQRLDDALSGPDIERLKELRELVMQRADQGGFGVDPEQWFEWQTVKLGRLKAVEDAVAEDVLATTGDLYETARNDLLRYVVIALLAFGLATLLATLIVRSITVPLKHALASIQSRGGDLTLRLDVTGSDELSQLYRAFNESTASTEQLVANTKQTAMSVKVASGEIAKGNQDLAQRTEEQSASLVETASSMEQMTATVHQTTDNAREAQKVSDEVAEQARQASQVATQARAAMTQLHEANQQVASIISTIDNIAFQTNLLALNASVEAARAGEHGRGFAVVAAEVRNLASRSASEADHIRKLIDNNVAKVNEGDTLVTNTSDTLEAIADRVKQMAGLVAEITAATTEESSGIEQINQAMTQLEEVTQHNAALVEQMAAASKSLDEQSDDLGETIGRFKVSPDLEQGMSRQESRPMLVSNRQTEEAF